ncbi:putative 1,3-beta-glucanosyltransferase gel2 [Glarea lozoyensis 74030]|uniref:1,3-beta-glucanosyltransferase n=1 Tax=Glarea lozoyensis (strain ATCC 74030 / MF5533) TaxID=1104152 RepID=H0EYG7_GLAL7|nr:putative 1,3-beta-glucanosyltransferase gel2 [Glarea lozoyensis 74030]
MQLDKSSNEFQENDASCLSNSGRLCYLLRDHKYGSLTQLSFSLLHVISSLCTFLFHPRHSFTNEEGEEERGLAAALQPIVIEGTDFINSATGARVQIVGVAYQPGGSSGYSPSTGVDPLSDGPTCLRDAALMQRLGINAIRVYNVNPDLNHNLVVEAFKEFPNTMAFFAGNEVIDDFESSVNAPYMRAVTRDLKLYIAANSPRYIPVGYSAADVRDILEDSWNYLQCTTTGDAGDASRVDLFALNSYSWCGNATYRSSGYDILTSTFASSSVPVFLSEYGCNEVDGPRPWTEIAALYGEEMRETMSGGVVYEWTQEENNYGLVELSDNGDIQLMENYNNLQTQLGLLDFTVLEGQPGRNRPVTPPTCEASLIQNTTFPTNFTLPATPAEAVTLIENSLDGANQGRLVTLTSLRVEQGVQDAGGADIVNLAVEPVEDGEVNSPTRTGNGGPSTSGTGTATGSGASGSASETGAASLVGVKAGGVVVGILGLLMNL